MHNFLIFKDLIFCCGHHRSPNSSLRYCLFTNILASRGVFQDFLLAGLAFNFQKQVGDPPNLAKVGIFHPLHGHRAWIGWGQVRGANPFSPLRSGKALRAPPVRHAGSDLFSVIVGFFLSDMRASLRAGLGRLQRWRITSCHAHGTMKIASIVCYGLWARNVKQFMDAWGNDVRKK